MEFSKNIISNIELKFAKNNIQQECLNSSIIIKLANTELITSNLELQIAFKEKILKTPKDLEDARHLRNITAQKLDKTRLKKYEVMLDEFSKQK